MDTWKEAQKKKMEVGGNKAFREYLQPYGLAEAAIEVKYNSKAAESSGVFGRRLQNQSHL